MTIYPQTFAVIGASEGALGLAVELRLAGRRVIVSHGSLDDQTSEELSVIQDINVDCQVESFVGGRQQVSVQGIETTNSLAVAAREADVIVLMTPQTTYENITRELLRSLRDDHLVLLCPGGLGGPLLISRLAAEAGIQNLLVAQTASMPIGARRTGKDKLTVVSKKNVLPVGVFPARRTRELLDRLKIDFPQLKPTMNVLECGLASAAPGLHPIPMIMNAAKIEADGPYVYDAYDITPTIANVIEALDEERQQILRAIGAEVMTISQLLEESYGTQGDNFYDIVHGVQAYRQVKSPPHLDYRYLTEDVPTQIVPAVLLATKLGVETPLLAATVAFANAMHRRDYWKTGWNLEKLGLSDHSPDSILTFLLKGQD
ncbi:NAD/NADP octopine/nopaline dehydrogenase family protein [Metarhizobium album]|uniref:NAD/NADP octopine/nopaline dehydrogenase family protein n=1 Tax=Metarhizobium album TaxID=2182425 RepID=UPI001402A0BE|nr:NAD/NADP octopine/nopaline dehydrogenase family protein [Rhizobium album]